MKVRRKRKWNATAAAVVVGGLSLATAGSSPLVAQTVSSVPDAQVEANVLKALASAPELSTQDIQSSTVYGVVTLNGTVQTEVLRTRAENLAARATGVKKVVDELTLGVPGTPTEGATDQQASAGQDENNQPVLQSDGTYAPAQPQQPAAPYQGPPANASGQASTQAQDQRSEAGAQQGYGQVPAGQPGYGPASQTPPYGQAAPGYGAPSYPQRVYTQAPPQPYPPPTYVPQGSQTAGLAVVVPSGSLLRIRINRGIDSNHIQSGTPFDGTVLSDVVGGGVIAIPRGAAVQGVVVDAKKAGALKGEGELALQINNVTLGGTSYPLTSDVWQQQGRDKSVRTVNSAVGLGVLGAIVGGVAGGGAGAAVGAGVGAGVGVAGSAASPGGRVILPPEAVLTFHVAQPAQVRTVSEQEMQRLAYAAGPGGYPGAPPVVRRRYYAPYYGPYYRPAPYPYPY